MKYAVQLGGRTVEVEVAGARVVVEGQDLPAQLTAIPRTPLKRLRLGNDVYTVAVLREGGGWLIELAGERWSVDVLDERTRQLQELTGGDKAKRVGGTIRAPMPGLVLRVEVTVGQAVEPGTPILVLEAMKMENEIRSAVAGVVKSIDVVTGQAVEKGVALVEIAEA